jgi:hypothetical protein
MEKNNIGKKTLCSQCTEEKIIASSGFGSEPYGDLCADCLEASSDYACDICERIKCDAYESHLLQEHSREQMAKYISMTQKD